MTARRIGCPTTAASACIIEKDSGRYDAINRGFRRAQGDLLAYLNCDEQYLPGAPASVGGFFAAHPEIEVALAGTIVVDGDGHYVCHRHSLVAAPVARLVPVSDAHQFGFPSSAGH
jgi:hypothetical protein